MPKKSLRDRIITKLPKIVGSDYKYKISTGVLALDSLTFGGFASGRIYELYGAESSGKTTLSLTLSKTVCDNNKKVIYFDYEKALDSSHAKKVANLDIINNSNFLWLQPDTTEDGHKILLEIKESLEKGEENVGLIVLDSLPAILPLKMLEEGDESLANEARAFTRYLLKPLVPLAGTFDITVVITNQLRSNIGGKRWEAKEKAPGAKALKFYAACRIELKNGGYETLDTSAGQVAYKRVRAYMEKDKIHGRVRETCTFYYNPDTKAVDPVISLMQLAKKLGMLEFRGRACYFLDEKIGMSGKKSFFEWVEQADNYKKAFNLVVASVKEGVAVDEDRHTGLLESETVSFSEDVIETLEEE